MARGRFVDKGTCLDKKINSLSVDSELGFILLLTHADCEGRVFGDPEIVRSFIFPRRKEITVEMVEGFIKEWHDAGMIVWYEAEDDMYIQFVNFEKHQIGLRKEKEAPSTIPPYIKEEGRSKGGNGTDKGRVKLKVKLSEVEVKDEVEVEVENDNNNTQSKELITTFCEHTKLKAGKNAEESASYLSNAGVNNSDVINAIEFLKHSSQHKCVEFKSIKASAIIEMDKRKNKNNGDDPEDYRRYLKGKYGKFGVH